MQAEEYLEQIDKFDKMIANKLKEVIKWQTIASNTVANGESERVQTSGSQQKMADAVHKYLDIEAEIEEVKEKRRDIINVLESLPAREYDLLHKIFVQRIPVKEIDVTKSTRKRIYKRAIANVQSILDERDKVLRVEVNML